MLNEALFIATFIGFLSRFNRVSLHGRDQIRAGNIVVFVRRASIFKHIFLIPGQIMGTSIKRSLTGRVHHLAKSHKETPCNLTVFEIRKNRKLILANDRAVRFHFEIYEFSENRRGRKS